jgi:hypothetical protein
MPDPNLADQIFGNAPSASSAPPTGVSSPSLADAIFGPAQTSQGGATHDIWYSLTHNPVARTLNAVGYGAQQGWGSEPLDLDDKTKADLTKAGVFNDYSTGRTDFFKTQNEAVMRGAAQAWQAVTRAPGAVFGGLEEGLKQAQVESEGGKDTGVAPSLTRPFAAAAQLVQETQYGAGMEFVGGPHGFTAADIPEVRASIAERVAQGADAEGRAQATTAARASAVVGEGEAGFYEAKPVTPENAEARATAAQEADVPPPAPVAPAPDIHVLARRIDPETFEKFDALAQERDLHRQTIADLGAERANSPEALAEQEKIATILGKVNNVPERLTKAAAQRLADAQGALDDILTRDTPEMAAARGKLMDADFAMRDMAPQVSDAYRQARDMAPELPEEGPAPSGMLAKAAEKPTTEEPGAPGQERITPVIAEASSEAAPFEPASVTGEQKLGATGREGGAEQTAASTQEGVQPSTGGEGVKSGQARYGNLRAVEGTGELKPRGLAENVEAKAIEDGLTSQFADLPEYRQLSMADQAAHAQRLMDEDYETAKAIAMGDRQPPKGLLPESVYVAIERRALAEGDVDTIQQLATRSRLTTSATTMGQRIRTLGERDKASPVGMIQEVQAAREADLVKRSGDLKAAKKATVDEIRAEVKKAASKPDAWADFIQSIKCGE